jgi:hypothetical protein
VVVVLSEDVEIGRKLFSLSKDNYLTETGLKTVSYFLEPLKPFEEDQHVTISLVPISVKQLMVPLT